MKKFIQKFAISFLMIFIISGTAFSANEYFKSIATGNWNANGTWQMSTDAGSTWIAATKTPNDSSGVITIQSPNTVTVTVSVTANQLIVNTGGVISINTSVNLTITDGSGEDLTVNSGGTISGAGNLQTQGATVILNIRFGASFNASLKVNTGTTSSYNSDYPNPAVYNGAITVDAGATFSVSAGGYFVRANNTVTNNGIINGNSSTFTMRGASLINNDTIRPTFFVFDTTTSLSGTGINSSANITVGSSGNISLAANVTFSPSSVMTIVSGGTLNPNTKIFNFNSATFRLNSGATVSNSGTFQTQNTVNLIIKSGSNFNAPLKVNTGTAVAYDDGGIYLAKFSGTITIDAGAVLNVNNGGYSVQSNNTVTNNGSITGSGSGFYMRGTSLTNNGSIAVTSLEFDSTTSITGTGTYTSNTILIGSSGNVTITNNVTFSPLTSFTVVTGGVFNPGAKIFTFTSGTFVLNNGAVVSGSGPSAGTMKTQGNVNFDFRNGSVFNSAVNVNSGTLNAYADGSPYKATFFGSISIDAGATLHTKDGGYFIQANNNVTNNGSITGNGSSFIMRGLSMVNNSSISPTYLNFDSTTTLSGTGTYTSSNITINSSGNVSLANNTTFSPDNFTINTGGILNPNTKVFTLNSGTLTFNTGSTISNSGTFQTQGTVTLNVRNGANFNAPLKVNTGTTTSYDNYSPYIAKFNGSMTIDAGASVNIFGGGYYIQTNSNLTNNGTISGSGSTFLIRSPSFLNNGSVTSANLEFDTTTSVSGAGTFTSSKILIAGSGNVSLANNLNFSPTSGLTVNGGGILNPNTFTFTLSSPSFTMFNGATVSNSGLFQTQGTITMNIKNGSNFNAPFKVNTGINTSYDDGSPYTAIFNGPVTVDASATLSCFGGGYNIRFNNNISNNGTVTSGGGSALNFYGTNFTNNGIVNPSVFNFQTGVHSLQGTGSWGTNANVITGSTVNLSSNHQMQSVTVNAGGAFNLSTFKLSLTASNPISNSGTFNLSTGAVEYNGTSAQSISTTGITYNKLIINNSAGTSLPAAVTVNDTLSVILGDLDLNGQILTIAPAGYLTETPGNTVNGASGYITTTRTINAPSSINAGGLGAVLTTAVNLGSTEIRRGHAVQSGLNGNTSFLRYFDITPSTNTGLNATLVYKYDDSELNGKVESASVLFKSTNSGTNWTSQGGTVNTSSNTITLTGISSFSRWSASSVSAVAAQIKLIMEGFYNSGTGRLNKKDTVRAYLRNIASPFAIVDSAKSVIDSVTFAGSFLFINTPSGTYYIQTKHRNSIETWSKSGGQPYTLGSAMNYDFTSAASQSYGNNMKQVNAAPLRFGIFSGDINQDGTIDATDLSGVDNDAFASVSGYVKTDITGDDFVDAADVSIVDNNAYNSVSVVRP
jgi:hypothetical protein